MNNTTEIKPKKYDLSNEQIDMIEKALSKMGNTNLKPSNNELPENSQSYHADEKLVQSAVNNFKKYKSTINNKKNKTKALLDFSKESQFSGKDLGTLLKILKDNQDEKHQDLINTLSNFDHLLTPYRDVPASQLAGLGLTYNMKEADKKLTNDVLMQYDATKIGEGDFQAGMEKLKSFLINIPEGLRKQAKELIALDDFSGFLTLAKTAMPYLHRLVFNLLKDVGAPFLLEKIGDFLEKKIEKPSNSSFKNKFMPKHDEGLTTYDQPQNAVMSSVKLSRIPGLSTSSVGYQEFANIQYHPWAVNIDYIKTVLYPERFHYRKPIFYPARTAIAAASTQFLMTTDASGNTASLINPQNPLSAGGNFSTSALTNFFILSPVTGFNPTNGTATTITCLGGPLVTVVGNIVGYRLVSFSVVVTPITSMTNSNASYQMSFFQEAPNSSCLTYATSFPSISQNQLSQLQYYQSGNSLTTYRMIYLPGQNSDDTLQYATSPGCPGGFYILVTGAPVNTAVCKVDISYVYEIIPNASNIQLSSMDVAKPGAYSDNLLTNLAVAMPAIELLTSKDVEKVTDTLESTKPLYTDLFNAIIHHQFKLPTKVSNVLSQNNQDEYSEISMYKEDEENKDQIVYE